MDMDWRQTIYKAALKNPAVLLRFRVRIWPRLPTQKTFPSQLIDAFQLLQMWAIRMPSAKPKTGVKINIPIICFVDTWTVFTFYFSVLAVKTRCCQRVPRSGVAYVGATLKALIQSV
jgi:hypothetical protein